MIRRGIMFGKGQEIDPGNPVAVWLCGLAAASNDLFVAIKNLDRLDKAGQPMDKNSGYYQVNKAERSYYFRLGSAHAHEALSYVSLKFKEDNFLTKESSQKAIKKFIASLSKSARSKRKKLLSYCSSPQSFQELYLAQIRHVTFHYIPNTIQKAIKERIKDQGGVTEVVIPKSGALIDTRYIFADEVMIEAMKIKIQNKHDDLNRKTIGLSLKMRKNWRNFVINKVGNIQTLLLVFVGECVKKHTGI